MASPVTVAIVEDLEVVRTGVRQWIDDDPEQRLRVVSVTDSVDALLSGAGRDARVVVLDLELGTEMVSDRVGSLCEAGYRVVVFSIHAKPLIVRGVLDAGASAFLDKHTERDLFVQTVYAAARDDAVVTPSMAGGILHDVGLSPREREALLHLFQGLTHHAIARRMSKRAKPGETISDLTVRDYIKRARAKFAAHGKPCQSTYALLASCIREGLIRPEEITDSRVIRPA